MQKDLLTTMSATQQQQQCDCYRVIEPNHSHQCNLCKRNFSACLYVNELSHKITLQANEIDQLKNELQSCQLQIRRQHMDFQHLNMKYVVQIDHVTEMQQQKEQADRELEELSARLFEEANRMVAQEKRRKHQLEQLLRDTQDQLSTEQSQLYELRNRMEAIVITPPPAYRHKDEEYMVRNDSGMLFAAQQQKQQQHDETTSQVMVSQSDVRGTLTLSTNNKYATATATRDNTSSLQLDHFRKFILEKQRRNSIPSLISDSSTFDDEDNDGYTVGEIEEEVYTFFQLYPTSPPSEYMRRCEIEDIEPCLQFGHANSRLCIKTLMDNLAQRPCFIERITLEEAKLVPPPMTAVTSVYYRPLWERLTFSPEDDESLTCSACGKRPSVFYRFRLQEQDDWLLIDQNCRDRLVAVCNFYSFIRNIQLGYYHQPSTQDLYLENIDLRLKMFYAR